MTALNTLIAIAAFCFVAIGIGIFITAHAQKMSQQMEPIVLIGFGLLILAVISVGSQIVHIIECLNFDLSKELWNSRLKEGGTGRD